MKPLLPLAALALLTLLLPSCAEWNLGQRIREKGEWHTGVDICHPVDGKLYRTPEMKQKQLAYILAPEVSYQLHSELYTPTSRQVQSESRRVCQALPTGRVRPVLVGCEGQSPHTVITSVEAIPAEARAENAAAAPQLAPDNPRRYGSFARTRADWELKLAAAPFDYIIDPALSLTHSVLMVPVVAVGTPVFLIWKACKGSEAPATPTTAAR